MWSFFSRDAAKDFGYEIGTEVEAIREYTIWKLHNGKKKSSGEPVSIFVFETTSPDSHALLDIAKLSLKRLKTLRHPSILTYVDSLETDKVIYLVVEPVEPLEVHLSLSKYTPDKTNLAISWGLHQIASGLTFLNKDCQLSHNNVCISSIFVDRAGEWRLFGFEYITALKDPPPIKVLPELKKYYPPEHETQSQGEKPPWAYDSWGLGCLIWETFNGKLSKAASLKNTGKIPSNLVSHYCELVCANPKSRTSPLTFIKKASKGNGFFKNKFVETMIFLREIHIKENDEKLHFFNNLSSTMDSFPQDICLYKVLPELVNAFEFGNAGSSILSPMFKLGKFLNEEEYQKKIVPCVIKMFSSKDRTTRVKLLQQMGEFIDHIQPSVVNSQIFPNVTQGFHDTNPTIRDHTIKSMMNLAPKLNYQNLNIEMLKHFARLQVKDEEPGIRTNTTVCLGKIASYLDPEMRKTILFPAFMRALRDQYPGVRMAGILALSATETYFSITDCANKVLPLLCRFTVDADKSIRDQTFKSIDGFIKKLQSVSDDPSLIKKMEEEMQAVTPSTSTASWTSWAVSSLADKLYKPLSKIQEKSTSQSSALSSTDTTEKEKNIEQKSVNVEPQCKDTWINDWDDNEISEKENVIDNSQMEEINENTNDWEEEWKGFEEEWKDNKLSSYFPDDQADPFSSTEKWKSSDTNEWDDEGNWETWDSAEAKSGESLKSSTDPYVDKQQAKLAREEKRRQRLKERQMAKPKKLGAQKISM